MIPYGNDMTVFMDTKIQQLIAQARAYMACSADPVHDLCHAERVVCYIEEMSDELCLNDAERAALVLAGWWHDVARTLTKRPSVIWMLFVDDLISALMLWRETIRYSLFGSVAGMSTRLIFCKSLGTGKLLTRLLLRRRTRVLLDILKDADTLDVLHVERIKIAWQLVEKSYLYTLGYRFLVWHNFTTRIFHMRTNTAQKRMIHMFQDIHQLINLPQVQTWHIQQFGCVWAAKTLHNITKRSQKIFVQKKF